MSDRIQHDDALSWLARQLPETAQGIVFDPPYSRYSPMRGREDGAAGNVSAPFSFMSRAMALCARDLRPKGIVMIFCDWKLLPDMEFICSISGLREQQHLAWCRSRPGGGGLFRGACDPVLIASRTPPDRVDKAAVKNWLVADCELPRRHPYSKPPEVIEYVLACRCGDVVLDPFAGSGSSRVPAENLGLDLIFRVRGGGETRWHSEPITARTWAGYPIPARRAGARGCTRAPRIPWARSSA
jgi:hypothetical protein